MKVYLDIALGFDSIDPKSFARDDVASAGQKVTKLHDGERPYEVRDVQNT